MKQRPSRTRANNCTRKAISFLSKRTDEAPYQICAAVNTEGGYAESDIVLSAIFDEFRIVLVTSKRWEQTFLLSALPLIFPLFPLLVLRIASLQLSYRVLIILQLIDHFVGTLLRGVSALGTLC